MKKIIILSLLLIPWELNAQVALPTFQGYKIARPSGSQTFSYTGSAQTFTISDFVSTITIKAWGAQGYGTAGLNGVSGAGGKGGYATGNLSVTSGQQVLKVYVGQQGQGSGHNGGSSYIGGVSSAETIAGNATMPNPDGGTMTGRTGNGLVVISW